MHYLTEKMESKFKVNILFLLVVKFFTYVFPLLAIEMKNFRKYPARENRIKLSAICNPILNYFRLYDLNDITM
tara:strand:+ start:1626 stop:1844 length:219 start_codon:yes stop_codon:yes gene_type:complete